MKAIIDEYNKRHKTNVPLIINDNIDVALAVDADGVHVGQGEPLNKQLTSRRY